MSYFSWFETHLHKRTEIMNRLVEKGYHKKEIIEYFEFENMSVCEPNFCPLYDLKQKCHNMGYLNCYFCACPYFDFNDEGLGFDENLVIKSRCVMNSKQTKRFTTSKEVHADCSSCFVPHKRAFVWKYFK